MGNNELIASYVQKSIQSARAVMEAKVTDRSGRPLPTRLAFYRLQTLVKRFIDTGAREQRWYLMPGLRGTGKSTLLGQVYLYLVNDLKVDPIDILYLSIDDVAGQLNCGLSEVLTAYESLIGESFETTKSKKFLLIDEAHFDPKWSGAMKSVYERTPNVFILATGSSAVALQPGKYIGADVARRAQTERLDPLRFNEYGLLKSGVAPADGLSDKIFSALFASATAKDVFEALSVLQRDVASYWTHFNDLDIQNYLDNGSFPYTLGQKKEESYAKIIATMSLVYSNDLSAGGKFTQETIQKFPRLVTLLASFEDVTKQTLADALPANHVTIADMIDALEKCQIVNVVPTFGGTKVILNRAPRYAFTATSVKAAYLWNIGKFAGGPDQYGKLLEDAVVQYLDVDPEHRLVDVARREGDGEADFILTSNDRKHIACEVGFGVKNKERVTKTMATISCKYGLVVAENQLALDGDTVFVPKRMFLMM